MEPEANHDAPEPMRQAWRRAVTIWQALPSLPRGTTCHALVRAFAPALGLTAVDGYFGLGGHTHAWLVDKGIEYWVIDVYPWASLGGPMLVCTELLSPWSRLYRPKDDWLRRQLKAGHHMTGFEEACAAVHQVLEPARYHPVQ